jgi:hypothetical protein
MIKQAVTTAGVFRLKILLIPTFGRCIRTDDCHDSTCNLSLLTREYFSAAQ